MMSVSSAVRRVREHKKGLALPLAVTALLLAFLALITLNHNAPLSILKGLYLVLDAAVIGLALAASSIRASVVSIITFVAIYTM